MIHAKKNAQTAEFTEAAWEKLPLAPDGTRSGWTRVATAPPAEVTADLKAKKSTGGKVKEPTGKAAKAAPPAEVTADNEAEEEVSDEAV